MALAMNLSPLVKFFMTIVINFRDYCELSFDDPELKFNSVVIQLQIKI
jgi:hypothetical protein